MSGRYSPDGAYERDREHRRDDGWEREPSNTVLIKSVPDELTEHDLYRWFEDDDTRIKDIRLIPRKKGSRGAAFAFIEFHSIQASADWMKKQQGVIRVSRDHVSGLVYSRRTAKSNDDGPADWQCPNPVCVFINFAKRNECFRCTTSKPSSLSAPIAHYTTDAADDGSSQIGANPCNTILIRGLDGLTTEQSLLNALSVITSLEPKNCYVMRNFKTGVSLGYAFMEFDSATNGRKIKEHFNNKQPFEVDGKLVMVDYAKNTYSTILASIQYQGMGEAVQSQQDAYLQNRRRQPTEYELQALAASSANQMASTQLYEQQRSYDQQSAHSQYTGTHQQLPADQTMTHSAQHGQYHNLPQYPEPDVSQYQWDAASGYYYDPSTGLYYDAGSRYYYNMTTRQFMYWDGAARTYLPVATEAAKEEPKIDDGEEEKDEEKIKAKNIAKEMEKWAKSQNKKSKHGSGSHAQTSDANTAASAADGKHKNADMAYDVLMGRKLTNNSLASSSNNTTQDDLMPPPPMAAAASPMRAPAPPASGLVASYGGDESDGEDDSMMNEANHIDRQKLTCNLCERKFNSTAILEKHVNLSGLHKQNLAKLQQKSQGQLTKQYRDRAKERRLKQGQGNPRPGGFLKPQFA